MMKNRFLTELLARYPKLQNCEKNLEDALELLCKTFLNGKKVWLCGNGGSEADADHITGELLKSFVKRRPIDNQINGTNFSEQIKKICDAETSDYLLKNLQGSLPAMSLSNVNAIYTAFANDVYADLAIAQQIFGLGQADDVLFAISTSGNSKNILYAANVARAKNLKVIALTGETGGKLKALADICLCVPEKETYKIQELHLPVYHALCLALEDEIF